MASLLIVVARVGAMIISAIHCTLWMLVLALHGSAVEVVTIICSTRMLSWNRMTPILPTSMLGSSRIAVITGGDVIEYLINNRTSIATCRLDVDRLSRSGIWIGVYVGHDAKHSGKIILLRRRRETGREDVLRVREREGEEKRREETDSLFGRIYF